MNRFKKWLFSTFLPAYHSQSVEEDYKRYRRRIEQLEGELERERSYSKGLYDGLRRQRKIVIYNGRVSNGVDTGAD